MARQKGDPNLIKLMVCLEDGTWESYYQTIEGVRFSPHKYAMKKFLIEAETGYGKCFFHGKEVVFVGVME